VLPSAREGRNGITVHLADGTTVFPGLLLFPWVALINPWQAP